MSYEPEVLWRVMAMRVVPVIRERAVADQEGP
jgi:hypothetical protein